VARVIAPQLGERLGQPIIVENRPGANGNLAMEVVAKAAPDGYTLLLGADAQIVINPHFYPNLPFDTMKDLVPVASVVNTNMVLAVNPALPVKNLQEFIDYARNAKPPLAYGSIGNGSQHHLVMEMLKQRAQIDLLHVPFKGGGPATMALIAGEISAAFGGNSVTSHVRAGKLRAPRRVLSGLRSHAVARHLRARRRCARDDEPLSRSHEPRARRAADRRENPQRRRPRALHQHA
jgi:tripartite-type tricarboxylate transporter receptor subunit TctC